MGSASRCRAGCRCECPQLKKRIWRHLDARGAEIKTTAPRELITASPAATQSIARNPITNDSSIARRALVSLVSIAASFER